MAGSQVLKVFAVLLALVFAAAACDGLLGIGVLPADGERDGEADAAPGQEAGSPLVDAEACVLGKSTVGHCVLR